MVSVGILRFGVFEADLRSGELRKNGARVKIQELPFRALRLLLTRPNEVITREDLRKAMWPTDVFVDFDHGISSAMNRLRDALGDSAENPIFIETVERRGYRWIAPVHVIEPTVAEPARVEAQKSAGPEMQKAAGTASAIMTSTGGSHTLWRLDRRMVWLIPLALVGLAAWFFRPASHSVRADVRHSSVMAANHNQRSIAEAEDFYLKGRFYWNKRTPDALNKAVDLFTQAIVRDPGYAKAYVGLADCYNLLREYTVMPASEAYPRALAAAKKAVELDDSSSEAHASLAFASYWGNWDAATADREFRRAIELDPRNAIAHHWYATFLLTDGRHEEALAEIDRARALDPSNAAILADKGDILIGMGRLDEAFALLQQMETTDPSFISPHRYLKRIYFERRDYARYIAEQREEATLMKDPAGVAIANAAQQGLTRGGPSAMLESLVSTEKRLYDQDKISPVVVAESCAQAGDAQGALHYLQIAVERHDENVPGIADDDSFKSLRADSNFQILAARAGTPQHP